MFEILLLDSRDGKPDTKRHGFALLTKETPVTSEPRNAENGPDFTNNGGLLPAIAQDVENGEVLMLAYMNEAAFQETCRTGTAVYFSRSRGKLWHKGEQSGHHQTVEKILIDCDQDTILLRVRQHGAACHEGYRSCFFRECTDEGLQVVSDRLINPEDVYG
jgi:phosphoribosyl-AMP cyclohydrolase